MQCLSSVILRVSFLLVFILFGCSEKSASPEKVVHYQPEVINPNYTGAMVEPTSQAMLVWGSDGVIQRSTDARTW